MCNLLQGWVRTDMTSRNGLIDAAESAGGLISVLESGLPLNGHWCGRMHEQRLLVRVVDVHGMKALQYMCSRRTKEAQPPL